MLGCVVALALILSYLVVGRDYVAVLDAHAYLDPTLSVSASRAAGPSGSVIQLVNASAGGLLEFSGEGVRAYSPTFAYGGGVAAVVPPVFRGDALGHGDFELRLLARRGPVWTSSPKRTFSVQAPPATSGSPALATLFGLHVTHGLVTNAADAASTAAAAGAPAAVAEHGAVLTERRVEIEGLSQQFELVAWGNSSRVRWSGLMLDPAAIRLIDQLTGQYFISLGEPGSSPCGDTAGAHSDAGLSARSAQETKAAAGLFVRSIVDCDRQQLGELAARSKMWLSALAYTTAEALRTTPDLPDLAALLELAMVSWSDEAVSATYLWKQYGHPDELRVHMLERSARPALPASLQEAAARESYLAEQLERIESILMSEARLLTSILEQDGATQDSVAAALEERSPKLATPSPIPVLPMPIWHGVMHCGILTEYRPSTPTAPGSITVAGEKFSIASDAQQDIGPRARVGNDVCLRGEWVMRQDHGRSLIQIWVR